MVVISSEEYSRLTDGVEEALDRTDGIVAEDTMRMSHKEFFGKLRRESD